MSAPNLGAVVIATLDDDAIARLADRLRPHLEAPNAGGTLLTAAEAAHELHLHPKTVVRMARDGRLPAVKIGTGWRFHPTQLAITPVRTSTTPETRLAGRSRARRHAPGTPASVRAIRGDRVPRRAGAA